MADRYAVIDTETSGLFDYSKRADAQGQPRLASFCMLTVDADLRITNRYAQLVRPDGWVMSDGAMRVTGLDMAELEELGKPVADALNEYDRAVRDGLVVVGHNVAFDTKVMRGELRRASRSDLYAETRTICTMVELTGVCKIPSARGRGYKWPRLAEALTHFNIEPVGDAHSAVADAYSCLTLLRQMARIKVGMTPREPNPAPLVIGDENLMSTLAASLDAELKRSQP